MMAETMIHRTQWRSIMNRPWFRLFMAIPLGLIVVLNLFSFMSWMVGGVKTGIPDDHAPMSFDVVMQEQDPQSQRRLRTLPEPPTIPESPQALVRPQLPIPTQLAQLETPKIELDTQVALSDFSVAVNMPTISDVIAYDATADHISDQIGHDIGQQQQAIPLYRAEPTYPANLLRRKVEGFVIMSFTISEQGKPENIEVLQSEPTKAFVRSAVQALRNWKYQPKIENGKTVKQGGQQVKIEFKISQ